MVARQLQEGDVLRDGSAWIVLGKVEVKSGRVFAFGHDSNTRKKVCLKMHPEEEVEVA